jgi:DNA glycosylase AlkZ-like
MTPAALRRLRATAQRLAGARAGDPVAVTHRLLAVQAQDPRSARLALRARGAAADTVDAALGEGALVTTWLLRGTLHLVARDDLGWLHALTGALTAAMTRRRLGQLGLDPERAGPIVVRALADDGPQSRAQLAGRLRAAGIDASGQRLPHLLAQLAAAGVLALGPADADGRRVVPLAPLAPFAPLPARAQAALRREARAVERFCGAAR